MKSWRSVLTLCFFAVLPALHSLAQSPQPQPLVVTVTPWGPGQAAIDTAEAMVSNSTVVLRYVQGTRNRLLSLQLLDSPNPGQPPNGVRLIFYDYTNNRSVIASGLFNRPETVTATMSNEQPTPSGEEFNEAPDGSFTGTADYRRQLLQAGALDIAGRNRKEAAAHGS